MRQSSFSLGFVLGLTSLGLWLGASPAQAQSRGAPIFVAWCGSLCASTNVAVEVFNERRLEQFNEFFSNAFAAGDVDGDGYEEFIVNNPSVLGGSLGIRILDVTGLLKGEFSSPTSVDELASGDIDGDGVDEILVAPASFLIDLYDQTGTLLGRVDLPSGVFLEALATGDLVGGDRSDEIVIATTIGWIYVLDQAGAVLAAFDIGFAPGDGLATGDVDGDGVDEILTAGGFTVGGVVEIWDVDGSPLGTFFHDAERETLQSGDVDGDGVDEIVMFRRSLGGSGRVFIFDRAGTEVGIVPVSLVPSPGIFSSVNLVVGDAPYPDQDGDGLLDPWERFGVDVDGDGAIDLPLPAWGASPFHKDLFLEFDWMAGQPPRRDSIVELKRAFANAPLNAGGIANPDGLPGINLWMDTGALTDPTAKSEDGIVVTACVDGADNGGDGQTDNADPDCFRTRGEDGVFFFACGDGIDNGGDGLVDGADPDCQVGDNFGGGNQVSATSISGVVDDEFYDAKRANFNRNRAMVFRYAISGAPAGSGGQGEVGGNDFIEYNHDPGTIMHELGHTLNLEHGGNVPNNCKPNYVSVMNYDNQFGIWANLGTTLGRDLNGDGLLDGLTIDYSPPSFPGGRGVAPLPTLVENLLSEFVILDNTDIGNQMAFVDATGAKVRSPLNQQANWNGDADPPFEVGPLAVNIDTVGLGGRPSACANGAADETLTGYDDWSNIVLGFRVFGNSQDAAINPVTEPEMTLDEMLELVDELNTTDIGISATDAPDPVGPGEELTYTLTLTNHGPNPASRPRVRALLPPELDYLRGAGGCSETPSGDVNCLAEELLSGASEAFDLVVAVDEGAVMALPAPVYLSSTFEVENLLGPDPDSSNNVTTVTTLVNRPPVAVVDVPSVTECMGATTTVQLDGSSSSDPDGDLIEYLWTTDCPDSTLDGPTSATPSLTITGLPACPLVCSVSLTVTDALGAMASEAADLTVEDTTRPSIEVRLSPEVLWPPDHRMVNILATVEVSDVCDPTPSVTLESILSDEPDDALGVGDGNTVDDIQGGDLGSEDYQFQLRAERAGTRDGRTYTVTYSATDSCRNETPESATVSVPHESR